MLLYLTLKISYMTTFILKWYIERSSQILNYGVLQTHSINQWYTIIKIILFFCLKLYLLVTDCIIRFPISRVTKHFVR